MTGKKELRAELIRLRKAMPPETRLDAEAEIFGRVVRCEQYKSYEALLIYVSDGIETDTRRLIRQALADGKQVFTPRCFKAEDRMTFHRITSFDDLEEGRFGLLEPKAHCEQYLPVKNALCVTPALAYDLSGHRLGFGRGFYDRFLSDFEGFKLGICYDSFIIENVFRESFDIPVDMIITDKREYLC